MIVYNVAVTVILLVEAPTQSEAEEAARRHVHAGQCLNEDLEVSSFESEPLTVEPDLVVPPRGNR